MKTWSECDAGLVSGYARDCRCGRGGKVSACGCEYELSCLKANAGGVNCASAAYEESMLVVYTLACCVSSGACSGNSCTGCGADYVCAVDPWVGGGYG